MRFDDRLVADQVDVCEMFDAEVEQALRDRQGLEPTGRVQRDDNHRATCGRSACRKPGERAVRAAFKTLWFDDNLNGKIKKDDERCQSPPSG